MANPKQKTALGKQENDQVNLVHQIRIKILKMEKILVLSLTMIHLKRTAGN